MSALLGPLSNHLWQSTLFGALVALAALALRSNHAQTRHWLWLAASAKFLVPFSLLITLGTRLDVPSAAPVLPALAVEQITTSIAPVPTLPVSASQTTNGSWLLAALVVWLLGAMAILIQWSRRWLAVRVALRGASRLPIAAPIPVLSAHSSIEPGVFGILRPVLFLPHGVSGKLSAAELDAILAHELSHVRRRDNLTAAVHMVVEALFWFHPLVWWIGGKLVEERERACDEAVLEAGNHPQVYAQSILNVCKYYVESPLPCASGVSGADLRRRIEEILTRRISSRLTFARKLILSAAAVSVLVTPLVIGMLRAQTLPPAPAHTYEVVSIRPSAPGDPNSRLGPGPQGGMRTQNTTVMQLLTFAYDLREYQFANVPGWVTSSRFDVTFTPDKPEAAPGPGMPREQMEGMFNRHRQRMQAVLRDRFSLVLRAETKELPMYSLTIAKGGAKLAPPATPGAGPHTSVSRGQITGTGAYVKMLTDALSSLLGRAVTNDTGLDGPFDFKVQWTPDPAAPGEPSHTEDTSGTSIFAAVQEQLGLKLDSKKGPVPVFVVERIEKPTEN